ncbi:MAG: hypothetical protein PF904_00730 [Kiritimatiellae bacterium]|jgi:hypothetical protein|nr:hypothetical protein [Kiritimatiellia bacterium]
MSKKIEFTGVVIWVVMLCLAPSVVTAATSIIQNGSFEEATNHSLNTGDWKNQGCELGTGTAAAAGTITACGVANWSGGGARGIRQRRTPP